jgi:type II secretory pathway component PulF
MNKIWGITLIFVVVVAVYIMMAVMMPAINDISTAAADSLDATSNMSNYPGTEEVVRSSGWWLWAVPGVVGIIATAVMLKKGDRS